MTERNSAVELQRLRVKDVNVLIPCGYEQKLLSKKINSLVHAMYQSIRQNGLDTCIMTPPVLWALLPSQGTWLI